MAKDSGWFRDRFLGKKRKQEQHAKMFSTGDGAHRDEPADPTRPAPAKAGRNDPCPLGKTGPGGKVLKFKHCCGKDGHDHCVELEKQQEEKK